MDNRVLNINGYGTFRLIQALGVAFGQYNIHAKHGSVTCAAMDINPLGIILYATRQPAPIITFIEPRTPNDLVRDIESYLDKRHPSNSFNPGDGVTKRGWRVFIDGTGHIKSNNQHPSVFSKDIICAVETYNIWLGK